MQDFDRTGGNRDSILGGHTQSSGCIRTQAEGVVTPQETEPDLPASVAGSPEETGGGCGSLWGQGHWQQKFWEVLLGVRPPGVCISTTKRPIGSSAGSPQVKQPTGRELSPNHQQTSRLKFHCALHNRATPSPTHHQSLPSGSLHKPLR